MKRDISTELRTPWILRFYSRSLTVVIRSCKQFMVRTVLHQIVEQRLWDADTDDVNLTGEGLRGGLVEAAFASDERDGVSGAYADGGAVSKRFNRLSGVAVET